MALRVNDIEAHIINGLANRNIIHLPVYLITGFKNRRFRRSIEIVHLITLWRCERCQFLAAGRKVLQRVVLDARGKLVSHLSRHKGIGDVLLLEIVVQGNQVETHLFGDDIHCGATREGRVHVHHVGIEAIAGVGCHPAFRLQIVIAMIPMDKGY